MATNPNRGAVRVRHRPDVLGRFEYDLDCAACGYFEGYVEDCTCSNCAGIEHPLIACPECGAPVTEERT